MKSIKRGLAALLAALLILPTQPVTAAGPDTLPVSEAEYGGTDESSDGITGDQESGNDSSAEEEKESVQIPDEDADVSDSDGEDTVDGGGESSEGSDSSDAEGDSEESEFPDESEGSVDSESSDEAEDSEETDASDEDSEEEDSESSDGSDAVETPDESNGSSEEDDSDSDDAMDSEEESGEDSVTGEADEDASESGADGEGVLDPAEGTDAEVTPEMAPEFGIGGVIFSTGGEYQLVINPSLSEDEAYAGFTGVFGEDGSYTIQIPEEDPFFPYEVQFAGFEDSEPQNVWFMTPDSTVEFGGHTFRVAANFTGNAVTQLSLNIAGDIVVIYPQEKEFGGADPISLLPLEKQYLHSIDLQGYTPLELTMVSVDSVFAGNVDLKGTDRVMWTVNYSDLEYYQINQPGDYINLSYSTSFEMIVGEPDQLAADNIRYIVYTNTTPAADWLKPVFYVQDENGARTAVEVKDNDYWSRNENPYAPDSKYQYGYESFEISSVNGEFREGYLALGINKEAYPQTKFTSVRVFEGWHESAESAMGAAEITGQIFAGDMSQVNAGYPVKRYTAHYVTLVSYDSEGKITGCLPVELYFRNTQHGLELRSLRKADGEYVSYYSSSHSIIDGCEYYTYYLEKGTPVNEQYRQGFSYYNDGVVDHSVITAAYVGHYASIAEAQAAGAADIKDTLFVTGSYDDRGGYLADYSAGVNFTVIIGGDGTEGQQVLKYQIKTELSDEDRRPSGNTSVSFYGAYSPNDFYVSSVKLQDSYAENNYIVFIVNDDVDRSNLALDFYANDSIKLYAAGSSTPEIPRKSFHDFSKGAVQFTASAENGENAKNYWVQIISRSAANGQLFINSLIDTNAKTKIEGGVTYTTREVMLDALHEYKHDIKLANMGSEAIANLSVVLDSSVVELDDYWTLTGNHELSGFTTTDDSQESDKLGNLAMVRLKGKEGVEAGTDITGTLTLKSGDAALVVMTLTGTVGDPVITTKEVPEAVKYVPYGTMIQNSNKYSWNTVTYELWRGNLPEGMIIRPNGELYGVPTEVGEFTFTVRMQNSYSSFDSSMREFTLIVKENTNENVEGQTDESYELTDRVTYDYNAGLGDQLMVSQGVYGEFVDLWLDGQKLTDGVDYTSESGSTRITIFAQTLSGNKAEGTHTLGIEFRTADTKTLKRAAQNYILGGKGSFDGDNNGSGNDNNNNGSGNNNNNNNNNDDSSSDDSSKGSRDADADITETSYTVVRGDTLWKIAVKFYGNGNRWRKIYEDNKDVLRDPNRLRAGQVLKIRSVTAAGNKDTKTQGALEGGTYTVQPGDSLWKIAAKVYGNGRRWNRIYEANTDKLSDASKIRVGRVLVIPE